MHTIWHSCNYPSDTIVWNAHCWQSIADEDTWQTHLKRDVHGKKAIQIHAPASTLLSPSWHIVSFTASLKYKCSDIRLLLKADTLYSLHVLQIARINEYLENFSSVTVKSSNSLCLLVKLFTGKILINTWHIYKDQCCNGFSGRQTTVQPFLVFVCRLMLFSLSLSLICLWSNMHKCGKWKHCYLTDWRNGHLHSLCYVAIWDPLALPPKIVL